MFVTAALADESIETRLLGHVIVAFVPPPEDDIGPFKSLVANALFGVVEKRCPCDEPSRFVEVFGDRRGDTVRIHVFRCGAFTPD